MLTKIKGDLWSFYPDHWVVVTTNLGWNKKGYAIMGAGVAKEAVKQVPDLPKWTGATYRKYAGGEFVLSYPNEKILCFPTKPLCKLYPELSWQNGSSLRLIERLLPSLIALTKEVTDGVYLPRLGCGNGGLHRSEVVPLLEEYLGPPNTHFYLVEQP